MSVRPALSRIIIMFMVSLMVTSPVQAGIIPGFVKKLNPFGSNSDINVEKIKKNIAKNIKELKKKAAKNDPRAMADLAEYYFNGLRMERNVRKAFELYQKAAAGGDAVGQLRMGEFYSFGLDMDNDGIFEIPVDRNKGDALRAKSLKGLSKLAGKKHGDALYILGIFHKRGSFGLEKSHKKSRKYLEKSAKKGHARGMYQFGEILLTEGGKNHKKACDFFVRSAISGFRRGIYAIGYCHEKGRGRTKDTAQAHQWYDYGAKHYSVDSMIRMADIHAAKSGDDNKKKAAEYYDMAIAEGSARGYAGYARGADDTKKAYYYQKALAHDLNNSGYLKEVQARRPKTEEGRSLMIGLEPGTYTRDDLLNIANKAAAGHAGAKEYVKDFKIMRFITSLKPVTLRRLQDGPVMKGKPLSFSDDGLSLKLIHQYQTSINYQIIISKWDIKTKELIQIRALDATRFQEASSRDGKLFLFKERQQNYWQHWIEHIPKLTVRDSVTDELLLTLMAPPENTIRFRNSSFVGGDKYINVNYEEVDYFTKKLEFRNKLFDAKTGKEVAHDYHRVERLISPDGLHSIIKKTTKGAEGEKDVTEIFHIKAPNWSSGTKIEGDLKWYLRVVSWETSSFSPDSRYLVATGQAYDLEQDKDLGVHMAASGRNVLLTNIPGTSFMLQSFNDMIKIFKYVGPALIKISEMPLDVEWSETDKNHIYSPDFTKVTIEGVRKGSPHKELYIQDITLPSKDVILAKVIEFNEMLKNKEAMDDILEMFEIGFDDQAIEQLSIMIAKNPTGLNTFNLMKKRDRISATSIGLVMKTAIDAALAQTDIIKIDLRLNGEKGDPGTGDAIVKDFVLFQSNVQKAGVRRGDTVISLDGRPYFRSNTPEMQDYIDSIQANQHVTMVVERDGRQMSFTYKTKTVADWAGLRNAMRQMFWYGLVANAAGHPDIADMAAGHIGEVLNRRIFTKGEEEWGDNSRQCIALLKAVALAKRGNHKAAYALLLTEKSLKAEDQWGVKHVDWDPDFFADLFKEPKKLAYILGKKVEDLPKLNDKKVTPADYWTLDGRLIKLGEIAIVKVNEGGSVID